MIFQFMFFIVLLISEVLGSPPDSRSYLWDSLPQHKHLQLPSEQELKGRQRCTCHASPGPRLSKRNVLSPSNALWPGGVVPAEIAPEFDQREFDVIRNAMIEIESRTCVRFVPRRREDYSYLDIVKGDGCYADLGFLGGRNQTLSLAEACVYHDTIVHELLHTLGLEHQHNAINRDDYVTILWENIEEDEEHNFDIISPVNYTDFGLPYDYCSIMHYQMFDFSYNSKPTIVPKIPGVIIREALTLSYLDTLKINIAYNCKHLQDFSRLSGLDYYADCYVYSEHPDVHYFDRNTIVYPKYSDFI